MLNFPSRISGVKAQKLEVVGMPLILWHARGTIGREPMGSIFFLKMLELVINW